MVHYKIALAVVMRRTGVIYDMIITHYFQLKIIYLHIYIYIYIHNLQSKSHSSLQLIC